MPLQKLPLQDNTSWRPDDLKATMQLVMHITLGLISHNLFCLNSEANFKSDALATPTNIVVSIKIYDKKDHRMTFSHSLANILIIKWNCSWMYQPNKIWKGKKCTIEIKDNRIDVLRATLSLTRSRLASSSISSLKEKNISASIR